MWPRLAIGNRMGGASAKPVNPPLPVLPSLTPVSMWWDRIERDVESAIGSCLLPELKAIIYTYLGQAPPFEALICMPEVDVWLDAIPRFASSAFGSQRQQFLFEWHRMSPPSRPLLEAIAEYSRTGKSADLRTGPDGFTIIELDGSTLRTPLFGDISRRFLTNMDGQSYFMVQTSDEYGCAEAVTDSLVAIVAESTRHSDGLGAAGAASISVYRRQMNLSDSRASRIVTDYWMVPFCSEGAMRACRMNDSLKDRTLLQLTFTQQTAS